MKLSKELFSFLQSKEIQVDIVRPSTTYWQDAWRRLKQNPVAIASLILIVLIILVALVGPLFSPYSYSDQDFDSTYQGPSAEHWFGTDG
ncbi:MAG: ABC transporter permease, partial [Clostridia bacterium]|nr:ABC transporter permease [Clostridia bacterium]